MNDRNEVMSLTVHYRYPFAYTRDPQAKDESESFTVTVDTFERVMAELSQETQG